MEFVSELRSDLTYVSKGFEWFACFIELTTCKTSVQLGNLMVICDIFSACFLGQVPNGQGSFLPCPLNTHSVVLQMAQGSVDSGPPTLQQITLIFVTLCY